MARLLCLAVAAATCLVAVPAMAQQRQPETLEQAGLRYLNWPGRPPVDSRPSRSERAAAPRPRLAPPPQPQTEPQAQAAPQTQTRAELDRPAVRPTAQPTAPATSTSTATGEGPRYYSVHRQAGRAPDPIDRAQVLAAEDTLVALQAPATQTLAEQERTSRAEEAFEILRNLPPDQLMEMLGRQP